MISVYVFFKCQRYQLIKNRYKVCPCLLISQQISLKNDQIYKLYILKLNVCFAALKILSIANLLMTFQASKARRDGPTDEEPQSAQAKHNVADDTELPTQRSDRHPAGQQPQPAELVCQQADHTQQQYTQLPEQQLLGLARCADLVRQPNASVVPHEQLDQPNSASELQQPACELEHAAGRRLDVAGYDAAEPELPAEPGRAEALDRGDYGLSQMSRD